jgi:hypothetical protein
MDELKGNNIYKATVTKYKMKTQTEISEVACKAAYQFLPTDLSSSSQW